MQNLQTVGHGRRAQDPATELRQFDPLTGLSTRALFRRRLDQQWERSQLAHRPLGLLLIEIEGLADYRRQHDKAQTRELLGRLGRCVSEACFRRADFAARLRLNQMAALLVDADAAGARLVAERMRDEVRAQNIFKHPDDPINISIGVASTLPTPTHFAGSLLLRADDALAHARDLGANRIFEAAA